MEQFVEHSRLAKHARYWRGFTLWRRALNAMGQGGPADSSDADFGRANEEFRHALRLDPSYVEAQIGLLAGLTNRVFFHQDDAVKRSAFVREYRPILDGLAHTEADNPRFVFVAAAQRFHAPPVAGGDRAEAIALVERAILRQQGTGDDSIGVSLQPRWGLPELHMLLATLLLRAGTNLDKAERHAEHALALRPQWRAVRQNLIPAIRKQRGAASG
jgi:tetratricopeptide (TPR) repeat protein